MKLNKKPKSRVVYGKGQSSNLTLMIAIVLLLGLTLYLINNAKTQGNDLSNEEDMFNLVIKQSLNSMVNTETPYKGRVPACASFGSIIAKASQDCGYVCNPDHPDYKNESVFNLTQNILRGYIEYLYALDDSFDYYIGVKRKNLICNGRRIDFEYGDRTLPTYEGEKFTTIERLATHTAFVGSFVELQLIVAKKEKRNS